MNGFWTFRYHNGEKQMEGNFKNGSAVGTIKTYHDNGKVKGEVDV